MSYDFEQPRRGLKISGFGILALFAVLVAGDQVRLHRPDHKFRLLVEVDTPAGIKSASNVLSVTPNRSYGGTGSGASSGPQTRGDAVFVDLGNGGNVVALLATGASPADLDAIHYLAMRAFNAAGRRVQFRDMRKTTALPPVPVKGELVPVLLTFTDPNDPASAHLVTADSAAQVLGAGVRIRDIKVSTVANGIWPLDFGGVLGEPVTRGIEQRLPWLAKGSAPAAVALKAAGVQVTNPDDARLAFER